MNEVWIAHLATTNFDFYLVAENEEIMWAALETAWNNHKAKTGATWFWEDVKDSVWFNKQQINLVWKR